MLRTLIRAKIRERKTCNIQEKLATQIFLVKNYNMKWTGQEELIGMLSKISPKLKKKWRKNMRFIHVTYNMLHNSIDVTTFDGYILRIDYSKAEEGLKNNALLRMCLKCFGNRQSPWIRNTVSWGRYAEMDRCGRFIRIVLTYFSLYGGLVKI